MLRNFFSTLLSLAAIFLFFRPRIREEEKSLISFFGEDYLKYAKNVKFSGVPFCSELTGNIDKDIVFATKEQLLLTKEE